MIGCCRGNCRKHKKCVSWRMDQRHIVCHGTRFEGPIPDIRMGYCINRNISIWLYMRILIFASRPDTDAAPGPCMLPFGHPGNHSARGLPPAIPIPGWHGVVCAFIAEPVL